MPTKVDLNKVWSAIVKDPEMSSMPKPVIEACKPYFMALPVVLEAHLDRPATLQNIMDAKMVFLRYCTANGYIKACIDASPVESFGFYSKEDVSELMQNMLETLIEMIEPIAKNALAYLKSQGVTEEQFVDSPQMGLKPEVLKLYKSKKLTIAKLLELQPTIIVKNTK